MSKLEQDMARLDKKLYGSGRKTKGAWGIHFGGTNWGKKIKQSRPSSWAGMSSRERRQEVKQARADEAIGRSRRLGR
jgi:hypothetical protein